VSPAGCQCWLHFVEDVGGVWPLTTDVKVSLALMLIVIPFTPTTRVLRRSEKEGSQAGGAYDILCSSQPAATETKVRSSNTTSSASA
jgi:hypothetical protein